MLDLQTVARQCLDEVEVMGIKHGAITSFSLLPHNNNGSWGTCQYNMNGTYSIKISDKLLGNNTLKGLKETIIHEILHSCDGCMNHGKTWKQYASIMNNRYGYNIKRVNSAFDKGLDASVLPKPKYKYLVTCPKCGTTYRYQRMCSTLKYLEFCTCGKCGSSGLKMTYL